MATGGAFQQYFRRFLSKYHADPPVPITANTPIAPDWYLPLDQRLQDPVAPVFTFQSFQHWQQVIGYGTIQEHEVTSAWTSTVSYQYISAYLASIDEYGIRAYFCILHWGHPDTPHLQKPKPGQKIVIRFDKQTDQMSDWEGTITLPHRSASEIDLCALLKRPRAFNHTNGQAMFYNELIKPQFKWKDLANLTKRELSERLWTTKPYIAHVCIREDPIPYRRELKALDYIARGRFNNSSNMIQMDLLKGNNFNALPLKTLFRNGGCTCRPVEQKRALVTWLENNGDKNVVEACNNARGGFVVVDGPAGHEQHRAADAIAAATAVEGKVLIASPTDAAAEKYWTAARHEYGMWLATHELHLMGFWLDIPEYQSHKQHKRAIFIVRDHSSEEQQKFIHREKDLTRGSCPPLGLCFVEGDQEDLDDMRLRIRPQFSSWPSQVTPDTVYTTVEGSLGSLMGTLAGIIPEEDGTMYPWADPCAYAEFLRLFYLYEVRINLEPAGRTKFLQGLDALRKDTLRWVSMVSTTFSKAAVDRLHLWWQPHLTILKDASKVPEASLLPVLAFYPSTDVYLLLGDFMEFPYVASEDDDPHQGLPNNLAPQRHLSLHARLIYAGLGRVKLVEREEEV